MDGNLKEFIEENIRKLCEWKRAEILELNIQMDHVHIVVFLEPKMSVSEFMGTIKGKLAIKIFQSFAGLKKKPYWGNHFWSRGYCSSTVGLNEEQVRKYVKYQEEQEKKEEAQQLNFEL
jgi:putative transposase